MEIGSGVDVNILSVYVLFIVVGPELVISIFCFVFLGGGGISFPFPSAGSQKLGRKKKVLQYIGQNVYLDGLREVSADS